MIAKYRKQDYQLGLLIKEEDIMTVFNYDIEYGKFKAQLT